MSENTKALKSKHYEFTCKKCQSVFNHASDIQNHLIEQHGLSLEETYDKANVEMKKFA